MRPAFLAAAAAIAASILAGAGSDAATPADTIVMARAMDDMSTPDPAEGYTQTEGEVIANCYDRIMRYEPEDLGKLVGEVAESWAVSDDGKTFTFKIRPGLTFHSGDPVTAQDAAFSLQRVILLNKAPASIIGQLGWTADNVKQMVTAPDAGTLRLVIARDFAPDLVLSLLSSSVASIVDEKTTMDHEVNGDLGNAWLKTHDAGSGPYMLKGWRPNDSILFEAYAGYRLGAPAIKHVVVRDVTDPSVQRLMLEKGDVDIARNLGPQEIAALSGNPDISIAREPSAELWYLGLNLKDPHLANPEVREAIRYLIDYQGIAGGLLKGQAFVHQYFEPVGFFAALSDTPYKLDAPKAKQLLAAAGYPDGFALKLEAFNFPPFGEIAQSIQQSLALGGIKADIVEEDHKQLGSVYRARKHQITTQRWNSDYLDPHSNALWFAYNADNGDNASSRPMTWRNAWYDPQLNQETLAASVEKDKARRQALYADIQQKVRTEGPFVFLFQINRVTGAQKNVKGFVAGETYDAVFYRLMTK